MSKDLLYAAIKSFKVPEITLDPGTYTVNETITLQGTVIVGNPTFFIPPNSFNYDDICTLASVMRVSDSDLLKALKSLEKIKKEERAEFSVPFRKVREYHHKLKEKSRKLRKGSISGNITIK